MINLPTPGQEDRLGHDRERRRWSRVPANGDRQDRDQLQHVTEEDPRLGMPAARANLTVSESIASRVPDRARRIIIAILNCARLARRRHDVGETVEVRKSRCR